MALFSIQHHFTCPFAKIILAKISNSWCPLIKHMYMILHLKTKTLSWPNSMLQLSPHFAVPLYIGALKNKMLSMLHLPLSSPSWTQSGLSAHHSTKMTFVEITILLEKYHTAVDHSLLLFALCHHILLTCLSLHWPLLLISFTGSSSSAQMLGGAPILLWLYISFRE